MKLGTGLGTTTATASALILTMRNARIAERGRWKNARSIADAFIADNASGRSKMSRTGKTHDGDDIATSSGFAVFQLSQRGSGA